MKIIQTVTLGKLSRAEEFAWLATAILTKLDLGIVLTTRSTALLAQIRNDDDESTEFKLRLDELAKKNKFGITELDELDVQRILNEIEYNG